MGQLLWEASGRISPSTATAPVSASKAIRFMERLIGLLLPVNLLAAPPSGAILVLNVGIVGQELTRGRYVAQFGRCEFAELAAHLDKVQSTRPTVQDELRNTLAELGGQGVVALYNEGEFDFADVVDIDLTTDERWAFPGRTAQW